MLTRAKHKAAEAEQVIPHYVAEIAVAITKAGLAPRVFSKMPNHGGTDEDQTMFDALMTP